MTAHYPSTANRGPVVASRRPVVHASAAFTLLELLVVIAIMALVSVLALPAFNQIAGGHAMITGTDLLVGQLARARQTAIALNRNVEVRFYSLPDDQGTSRYASWQTFIATDDLSVPWKADGRVQKLPSRLAIDSGASLSPLIANQSPRDGSSTSHPLPNVGSAYKFVTLTFRPDGTALPAGAPTAITVREARLEDGATELPANYGMVQIFPSTGLIRSFRP
jgi:uncharacterized protein (TIGR02596 family)